ncbi:hypothetical protein BDW69DRAFT_126731 [Aspergillus filifer]
MHTPHSCLCACVSVRARSNYTPNQALFPKSDHLHLAARKCRAEHQSRDPFRCKGTFRESPTGGYNLCTGAYS